ncbi:MAG: methyltransferase domain-containing protein [Pseudomonadota bacterium]
MPDLLEKRIIRSCPNCSSQDHKTIEKFSTDKWSTVRCVRCHFIFLSEAPEYETLSEDLAWTKQFEKEKVRRKETQPIIAWLDQKTRWRLHIARDDEWAYISDRVSSGRVLDIGCGKNNHIPAAFIPYGIEIEKAAAEAADVLMRAAGGQAIHAPALDGLATYDDDFFDGIIMRSYLEHELNPKEVLLESFRVLKPGGAIYVKVPNFGTLNRLVRGIDWCGFRFPDHLNYFDIRGMTLMATDCGFEMELKNKITRYTNDNMHCFLTKPA